MVGDLTSADTVRRRGLFDAAAVARFRDATLAGRVDGAYPLLAMMVIELWCRAFADSPQSPQVRQPIMMAR